MRRILLLIATSLALALAVAAASADETFTIAGVHVDATGASAVGARNAAIANGRLQAWQTLFRRITRQQDWLRQPNLTPEQLQRYITTFMPTSEKRSTTRYVADVTYMFNRGAVSRLLQNAKIAYAETQAKRVLVIPMAPGYARFGSWTAALANPRFSGGIVPFTVPVGDPQDVTALNGINFEDARWADVAPVAARRGASEAVLIQAAVNGERMSVTLKRLGANQQPVRTSADTALMQGGAASTYANAADLAVRLLGDMWKNRVAVDFSHKGALTVEMPIAGLERFAAQRKQILALPTVSDITVEAINTGEAQLKLVYQGSITQLQESLTQAGYELSKQGEDWHLTHGRVKSVETP